MSQRFDNWNYFGEYFKYLYIVFKEIDNNISKHLKTHKTPNEHNPPSSQHENPARYIP